MRSKLIWLLSLVFGYAANVDAQDHPVTLSQQLIYNIYSKNDTKGILQKLSEISEKDLSGALSTDSLKTVFWINCFNAAVQLNLTDSISRAHKNFFKRDVLVVAGKSLSLGDIEHGMLRKSKTTRGKKKRNKWIVSDFEKKYRVNETDYRVFFGLNTGVSGEPYIYFHSPESIDRELSLKMRQYIAERMDGTNIRIPKRFEPYYLDLVHKKRLPEAFPGIQRFYFEYVNDWVLKPRHFIGNK